jgi:TolB-like protein
MELLRPGRERKMLRISIANLLIASMAFLTIPANAENVRKANIAVMPFSNLNISEAEANALTARLVGGLHDLSIYDVLEREQMRNILKEQGFQRTGACDETSCLVEVGKLLSVEKVVGGSISKTGEMYTVQARIIDLQTGKVEKTVRRDYKSGIDGLMIIGMSEVAAELCGKLPKQGSVKVIISQEQRYRMERKSPVLACLMSALCPGLGQVYCKQYLWGVVFFSGFLAGVAGMTTVPSHSIVTNTNQGVGATFVCSISWGAAVIEAPYAVVQNNNQQKEKYGISLWLNPSPREPRLSLNVTF